MKLDKIANRLLRLALDVLFDELRGKKPKKRTLQEIKAIAEKLDEPCEDGTCPRPNEEIYG